jgi:hypothetical protein
MKVSGKLRSPAILHPVPMNRGARGGVVLKALTVRSRVRFPMVSLDFFSDIILPICYYQLDAHISKFFDQQMHTLLT